MATINITSAASFGNALLSVPFTRECSPGSYGSVVNFVVAADSFFGATQEDADAAALAYAMTNGQAYANNPVNGGTCTPDAIWAFNLNGSALDVPEIEGTFYMKRGVGELLSSTAIDTDNPASTLIYQHSVTPMVTSFFVGVNLTVNTLTEIFYIDLYAQDTVTFLGRIEIPAGGTGDFTFFQGAEYTEHTINGEFNRGVTITKTADFQKNNCAGVGETGSFVTYSRNYTGVDEAAAQAAADADSASFNTDGQLMANLVGTCNPPLPSDAVGILVFDLYADIDSCAYLDTIGTVPYQMPIAKGLNFLPNDGTPAANCWGLSSDIVSNGTSLRMRYEFNVARLINTYYPAIRYFNFKVRGWSPGSAGTLSGAYSLKGGDAGDMTMSGSPGSYIPSTSGDTSIGFTTFSGKAFPTGSDGTVGIDKGDVILEFIYDAQEKTYTFL